VPLSEATTAAAASLHTLTSAPAWEKTRLPDGSALARNRARCDQEGRVLATPAAGADKNADGSDVVDLYIDREKFRAAFAGDVDLETAQVMAVAQRPFTETAFGAPSGPVAWRSVPSWYLLGTEDRAIPPATQRYMAERATASIVDIAASHASMVSQPDAVTELIRTAVESTAAAPSAT
jgi:pimeloyl-ACP methyl ester carboxylesterase